MDFYSYLCPRIHLLVRDGFSIILFHLSALGLFFLFSHYLNFIEFSGVKCLCRTQNVFREGKVLHYVHTGVEYAQKWIDSLILHRV